MALASPQAAPSAQAFLQQAIIGDVKISLTLTDSRSVLSSGGITVLNPYGMGGLPPIEDVEPAGHDSTGIGLPPIFQPPLLDPIGGVGEPPSSDLPINAPLSPPLMPLPVAPTTPTSATAPVVAPPAGVSPIATPIVTGLVSAPTPIPAPSPIGAPSTNQTGDESAPVTNLEPVPWSSDSVSASMQNLPEIDSTSKAPIGLASPNSTAIPTLLTAGVSQPASPLVTGNSARQGAAQGPASVAVLSASSSAANPDGVVSPRWLSATFTSAERQRLDAPIGDLHHARASATADQQNGQELEPTRMGSPAYFCDGLAPLSLGAQGLQSENDVPPGGEMPAGPAESLSMISIMAAHDRAIADWDAGEDSATPERQQIVTDHSQTPGISFELLQDYKTVAGALMAEIVLGALWSRQSKRSAAECEVRRTTRAKR